MNTSLKWKEAAGVFTVLAILLGLPVGLWYWRTVVVPHQYPPGTRLIWLTATANGGIWTQERIVGYNYWWRTPTRTDEIEVNQGDHVVVRVSSSDVLHSFAIPILHVGPVDVQAGHTVEVSFTANRSGALTFLCWQMCSPDHGNLHGRFLVKAKGGDESW
jgi:cytochrome c oxidase subunit II